MAMLLRRMSLRLLAVNPLVLGLFAGLLAYLTLGWVESVGAPGRWDTNGWNNTIGRPEVTSSLFAAGTSVAWKAIKDIVDKASGGPVTTYKDMYDIASQDTPEAQSKKAWEVYKDLIMTKNAPPGSTGDELNKTIDRVNDFAAGGMDLD